MIKIEKLTENSFDEYEILSLYEMTTILATTTQVQQRMVSVLEDVRTVKNLDSMTAVAKLYGKSFTFGRDREEKFSIIVMTEELWYALKRLEFDKFIEILN